MWQAWEKCVLDLCLLSQASYCCLSHCFAGLSGGRGLEVEHVPPDTTSCSTDGNTGWKPLRCYLRWYLVGHVQSPDLQFCSWSTPRLGTAELDLNIVNWRSLLSQIRALMKSLLLKVYIPVHLVLALFLSHLSYRDKRNYIMHRDG